MIISGLQMAGIVVGTSIVSMVLITMASDGKVSDLYMEIDILQKKIWNNKTVAKFELTKRELHNSGGPCNCKYKRHCHIPRQLVQTGSHGGTCSFIDLISKKYERC